MSGTARLLFPLLMLLAALIVWLIWGPCPGELKMPVRTAVLIAALALFVALHPFLDGYFKAWTDSLIILVLLTIIIILLAYSPVMAVIATLVLIAAKAMPSRW
jgi:hypothetical protein